MSRSAESAFQRTVAHRPALALNEGQGGNPARDGVSRLRGAYLIEITKVRPDPKQPRREFNELAMEDLTASVMERGIKQPVRVWYIEADGVYQIISGERRYRAAVAAGMTDIPCMIEDAPGMGQVLPRREILVDQVVENWQREDLNPYDLSDALKELRDDHGLAQEQIARMTGKPKSEISRFLAMQRVTPEVQKQIRADSDNRFSRRHVVAISQLPTDEQPALAEKVSTQHLSAVETEKEVARHKKRRNTGEGAVGYPVTVRRYVVGSTKVQFTFRKRDITTDEVLTVLDRVRGMVEESRQNEHKE